MPVERDFPPAADEPPLADATERGRVIDRLFREHNQGLVRFLMLRLSSAQDAREVAQEAYVRLLQLDRPGAIGFLRTFLFKTAANIAVDRLRHRQTVRSAQRGDWFDLTPVPIPEARVSAQQEVAVIEHAIEELPPRCREAFLLSRIDGLGTREIARRMRLGERMVRLYLARAVLHCRQRLDVAHIPMEGRQ